MAYMPILPKSPKQNLARMLSETNCQIIITDECFLSSRPALLGDQYVLIDQVKKTPICFMALKEMNKQNPISIEDDIAYAIYTSGSTGQPKGTLISHQAVVNCATSIIKNVNITGKDVFLSITSCSFDVFVLDYLLPLFVGAKVFVANEFSCMSGERISELLRNFSVSIMQATPTVWGMLVNAGWSGKQGFKILSAGEKLLSNSAMQLTQRGELYNAYGPTETTIYATLASVQDGGSVDIGRPLDNVQCYILDKYLTPVPIGVVGELYIAGAGLSDGYINNSLLTQEKFIEAPLLQNQHKKLYATGDLVSWLPDGSINYIGRKDDQIKIRGMRLEAGEVEAALVSHPSISSSSVLERNTDLGQQLVAFITFTWGATTISHSGLSKFLMDKLPDYMVPSLFVTLDFLPVTNNGKIDRKLLSEYPITTTLLDEEENIVKDQTYTEVETLLIEVFKYFLQVNTVHPEHNFFDIGVHSLMLMRIKDRLGDKYRLKVEIVDFFNYPSIRELASKIQKTWHGPLGASVSKASFEMKTQINPKNSAVAIIACTGLFPGSHSSSEFWASLCEGKETLTQLTDEELLKSGIDEALLSNPNYVKSRGIIENIDSFLRTQSRKMPSDNPVV